MRSIAPLLLSLTALVPGGDAPAAAEQPAAVEVLVRLLATTPGGPTRIAGLASAILAEGELGVLDVAAGVVSEDPPRCTVSTLSGSAAPPPLAGPGYRWRVVTELREANGDRFDLRVEWTREGQDPEGRAAAAGEELHLRLDAGEPRHLDYARFTPVTGDASCAFDALVLEIEPRARIGHPDFAGRDLDYEVWFTRTAAGAREQFSSLRIVAPQGERLALPIEALETELDLGPGSTGRLRTGGRLTLAGWRTGRDTVTVRLEAVVRHRFDPGAVRVSLGEGSKLYEARLGEAVEIELPPLLATLIVPVGSLELAGAPGEGITVDGETARVDLARLAGEAGYSLVLRVSDAG